MELLETEQIESLLKTLEVVDASIVFELLILVLLLEKRLFASIQKLTDKLLVKQQENNEDIVKSLKEIETLVRGQQQNSRYIADILDKSDNLLVSLKDTQRQLNRKFKQLEIKTLIEKLKEK